MENAFLFFGLGAVIATTLSFWFWRRREVLSDARLRHSERVSREEIAALRIENAKLGARLESEREATDEKLAIINAARDDLKNEFKVLANDILDEKKKNFTEHTQATLGQILTPVRGELSDFRKRIDEVHVSQAKDRDSFMTQMKLLRDTGSKWSENADNLTRALKGSSKVQGDWGEVLLEQVLQSAGLRKGEQYDAQDSHRDAEGRLQRPDVVVHLPGEREIVIDAKVSLNAYLDFVNAENDTERELAMRRHIESLRTHIKALGQKNYQDLFAGKTLDCVILFVPIEPAFLLALQHGALQTLAWEHNVLLVSPSTLLFALRTVAQLWRYEDQARNVTDIAKRAGDLYDKFVGFVEDFEKVGVTLQMAQKHFGEAHNKLSSGNGNLIRRAEGLRALGVKPNKKLPQRLVENNSVEAGGRENSEGEANDSGEVTM